MHSRMSLPALLAVLDEALVCRRASHGWRERLGFARRLVSLGLGQGLAHELLLGQVHHALGEVLQLVLREQRLGHDPELRIRDLAERVGITERAAQRILHDLVVAGYVERSKHGRRNTYRLVLDRPLLGRSSVETYSH